jgi:hypothetical protein
LPDQARRRIEKNNRLPLKSVKTMFDAYSRPATTKFATEDLYPPLLALLLAGYAILSKAFAYLGLGPFYVGELVFALGVVAFLRSGCAFATLTTLPCALLALLFGWAVIRAVPYLGQYGVAALRDSVIVAYAGFAFIVIALLLEKPERLPLVIVFLRALGRIIVIVGPVLLLIQKTGVGPEVADMFVKPGTLAVHLSGFALMMLLGFSRVRIGWLVLVIIGMSLASMFNRGAMLISIIPLTFAVIATGKWRQFTFALAVAVGLIGGIYALGTKIDTVGSHNISATQLANNFVSIFSSGAQRDLQGTKDWRLDWWHTIYNYTFDGPYFWTGKGFGVNLALEDGFEVVGGNSDSPLLRSPHNGHLTILARAGVPGLALWLLTLGSWSAMLLTNMVRARTCGDNAWADFFVLIFCYALGFIIEGAVDVSLEGPMSGIWFWCLFGVGAGATMIYRAGEAPSRAAVQRASRRRKLA